ncbi:MAG: hypothetical protein FJ087_06675, partial [Deltaproteobacteria bacterium]|nr:hypothetical protein [Deltaproteobacteria bacterium]
TVPVREECGEGAGECVAGAICIPWDETRSYCRSACTFDGKLPCAGEYELCVGDPAAAGVGADLGVCLGDPCTPPAEGCGEDARCTVLVAQVFACVPAGPVPIDGDCEVEECVAGAICKHVDDGGYLCRELCRATEDCTPGQRCVFPFAGIGDWGWCEVPVCDPVLQTGCAEGDACYYEDPEEGSFLCWDEGSLAVGADCSNFNLFCAPGADCFPDPGSDPDYTYHCYAYCDEAHPCAAGTCQDTVLVHGVRLCMP